MAALTFTPSLLLLLLLLLLLSLLRGASAEGAAHYNYEHAGSDWTGVCATGAFQTPINIVRANAVRPTQSTFALAPQLEADKNEGAAADNASAPTVSVDYQVSSSFTLENNGHNVNIKLAQGTTNTLTLNGIVYNLVQGHAHSFSEHSFEGYFTPMEIHLVHKKTSNASELLVLGVLFRLDAEDVDNPFIDTWLSSAPTGINASVTVPKPLDFTAVFNPGRIKFFSYHGSLSTPGCDEVVTWLLVGPNYSPTISEKQVEQFELLISTIYGGVPVNNRASQARHNRTVYKFFANPLS